MFKLLVISAVMVASTANATEKDIATSKVIAPFSAIYTESATRNYETSEVYLCGGIQVSASVCASYFGDTYLRLVDASGFELVSNDDACDEGSAFTTTIPNSYGCGTFYIRQGCYGSGSCGGTVSYTTSTPVSAAESSEQKKLSTYSELMKSSISAAPATTPPKGAVIVTSEFVIVVKDAELEEGKLSSKVKSAAKKVVAKVCGEPESSVTITDTDPPVVPDRRRLQTGSVAALSAKIVKSAASAGAAPGVFSALKVKIDAAQAADGTAGGFLDQLKAAAVALSDNSLNSATVDPITGDAAIKADTSKTKKGKKGDKKDDKGKKGKGDAKAGKDSGKSGKKDKDSGKKAKDSGKASKDSGKKGKGKKL